MLVSENKKSIVAKLIGFGSARRNISEDVLTKDDEGLFDSSHDIKF